VKQKQSVNVENFRLENLTIDSTNFSSTRKDSLNTEKKTTDFSKKKLEYSFGRVIDKSKTSGCSFVIVTNDSLVFEPFNLDERFKKDGLEIIFKYRKSRAMTTCMMGQTIIVSEVKAFK
jgi:hypothetical protein